MIPPRPPDATRVILIRHGEPDESVRGRCHGRLDPGLSPGGVEQMRRAWLLLRDQPVAAMYASPSRRAVESARILAARRPAVTLDDRLREIDFGDFEGLAYDDIAKRFPERYDEWMSQPTEVSFPGGESFRDMSGRVLEAVIDIRRRHHGDTVVTVSHGGVNRIALAAALDLDPRRIFRLDQGYGSVNVIDYFGDEPLVRLINVVPPRPC